ncbi:hypothetical protein GMORB2_0375 [Geosmithia morbida]|uniref:Uncharacterized protein n=1 Tax=Geosmithia morbida TaxID=1094350 RepID=A0A9P4Z3A3_9HYPO|nr:uncharacterized protein GMORB2_0375 [Geosmithia morbida]KAF4126639.1 hypothetical protein GMORB2_0375 [Geosmithia morbida]
MYPRAYDQPKPSVIRMDPDCAICRAPAHAACECEAKDLDMAIRQAEDRVMKTIYADIRPWYYHVHHEGSFTDGAALCIRSWVRGNAQDYILGYFRILASRRRDAHAAHMEQIHSQAFYHYNAPPHPQQVADAEAGLKRDIDEAWRASVERYPDVLEYFFNLVELSLPGPEDPAITDPPPLAELTGRRKSGRRTPAPPDSGRHGHGHGHHEPLPAIGPPTYSTGMGILPSRTPPPPADRIERRPREKRASRHSVAPPAHAPYTPHAAQYAPYM